MLFDKIKELYNDIKWIKVSEIDNYDFCPADEEILIRLKERL